MAARPIERVALICGNYQPSLCGVAHYVQWLATELEARGLQPTILTATPAATGRADGTSHRFGPACAKVVGDWRLHGAIHVARAIARLRPDVVHIQYAPSSFGYSRTITLLPPLIRLLGLPTVTTVHEYGGWEARLRLLPRVVVSAGAAVGEALGLWDREALLLVSGSDRVIVTNPGHRDLIRSRLRALNGALRVIPIGPNVSRMATDAEVARLSVRARHDIASSDPLLCFFGFIHPVKGIDTLLRAFALLRAANPRARLALVGGFESLALNRREAGDYRLRIEALIAELGLTESVHVTGYLPEAEVSAYLSAADAAVLPFNHGVTPKSGSLLAALAHGLPTVVTPDEHAETPLRHGEQVWTVPPRNPEALAAAMRKLLGDPDLRAKLRAGALTLAESYSWRRVADEHAALYAELVKDRRD